MISERPYNIQNKFSHLHAHYAMEENKERVLTYTFFYSQIIFSWSFYTHFIMIKYQYESFLPVKQNN